MTSTTDLTVTARDLLRSRLYGVLSTLSVEMRGWPFGSLAPYVMDHEGTPYVLISRLAEHTRNLDADARVSLLARALPKGRDAQAVGRVTVLARAARTQVAEPFRARFIRYLPEAEGYLGLGDFAFYRLAVERVRYIGGFGAIHWIEPEDFLIDPGDGSLEAAESEAVAHMNRDHADALRRCCLAAHGVDCTAPRLLGCDPEGIDIEDAARTPPPRLRLRFPAPVHTPEALRNTLAQMARDAGGAPTA